MSALFAQSREVFTGAELDDLERYGDRLSLIKAPLLGAQNDHYESERITQVAALKRNDESAWIYERMTAAFHLLNRDFGFNLTGFNETIQFMVYRAEEGGHFNWHVDEGPSVRRKLSLTLQLTDPAQYQGCELQFDLGGKIEAAPRERGTVIAFPSYVRHRVSPITSGTRKAVVAWIG